MNYQNENIRYKNALETKNKWENIINNNIPYKCKKCGKEKIPTEFVKHYMESSFFGKIQILHECKECKRQRIYNGRNLDRKTIQGTIEIIYKQIKQGAKLRKLQFDITKEDLLNLWHKQDGKCYYTGYQMQFEFVGFKDGKLSQKSKYQISCDRLDNSIGYTSKNIVLCTTLVNKMKGVLSQEEFLQVCKDILKTLKSK